MPNRLFSRGGWTLRTTLPSVGCVAVWFEFRRAYRR